MQSIVRHDYYPSFANRSGTAAQRVAQENQLHSVEAMAANSAVGGLQRSIPASAIPASAIPAAEPRRIDVFRLIVAAAGLIIYLGLPAAVIAYLVIDLAG
jgi:hypothetical protein